MFRTAPLPGIRPTELTKKHAGLRRVERRSLKMRHLYTLFQTVSSSLHTLGTPLSSSNEQSSLLSTLSASNPTNSSAQTEPKRPSFCRTLFDLVSNRSSAVAGPRRPRPLSGRYQNDDRKQKSSAGSESVVGKQVEWDGSCTGGPPTPVRYLHCLIFSPMTSLLIYFRVQGSFKSLRV